MTQIQKTVFTLILTSILTQLEVSCTQISYMKCTLKPGSHKWVTREMGPSRESRYLNLYTGHCLQMTAHRENELNVTVNTDEECVKTDTEHPFCVHKAYQQNPIYFAVLA